MPSFTGVNGVTGFTGIWVPLVTPFQDNEIDVPALQALARKIAGAGVSGLVVCGSTGEAAALDESEQLAVLDAVIEAVPDCPVVMGLAGNNLRASIRRLQEIQRRAIVACLVPPPYYIRPAQAGITAYFQALADTAAVPVILYNIPYRTGVSIEFDTFSNLARHERVCAVKDCGGDMGLTMRLLSETPLQVLAGEDAQLLATLCLGGSGGVLASAHIRPDLYIRVWEHVQAGELGAAREVFYRLLPLIRRLFAEPNPAPLKAALAMADVLHEELRAPMQPASGALREELSHALSALNYA